jgi:hypothetical protein
MAGVSTAPAMRVEGFWKRVAFGFAPESQRLPVSPPLACAMVVYLRTGPDEYQAYGLLGGP